MQSVKDILTAGTVGLFVVADTVVSGTWPDLVEKFGSWVIWLAIAIYLFKRGERREEEERAYRSSEQEKFLKEAKENSQAVEKLVHSSIDAIHFNAKQIRTLAKRMKSCPMAAPVEDANDDED